MLLMLLPPPLLLLVAHHACMPACREFNFVKQQQVALKLHKLTGHDQYMWWIILSITLQARDAMNQQQQQQAGSGSSAVLGPSKLCQLAEGMVSRQMKKDGKMASWEALIMYLDLLLGQVRGLIVYLDLLLGQVRGA